MEGCSRMVRCTAEASGDWILKHFARWAGFTHLSNTGSTRKGYFDPMECRDSTHRPVRWNSIPRLSRRRDWIHSPTTKSRPESPLRTPQLAERYPLILTTGAKVHAFFHSEHRQIPTLRHMHPDPIVEIHPETASQSWHRGRRLGLHRKPVWKVQTEGETHFRNTQEGRARPAWVVVSGKAGINTFRRVGIQHRPVDPAGLDGKIRVWVSVQESLVQGLQGGGA